MSAIDEVRQELERARAKFPAFNSGHEGYAVLLEEVEELKAEVFWGPTTEWPDPLFTPPRETRDDARTRRMRAEAIQVAAMAIRFIEDVCGRVRQGGSEVSDGALTPTSAIAFCRCRAVYPLDAPDLISAWMPEHSGDGHRVETDRLYRAACRSHVGGCRQCGEPTRGRLIYYCSPECRKEFEANHFWSTARSTAILRTTVFDIRESSNAYGATWHRRVETFCARCWLPIHNEPEVNHIVPVNGDRQNFGCQNHQDNLEPLCHSCHLTVTAEQRAAGLIGPPRLQQRLSDGARGDRLVPESAAAIGPTEIGGEPR